MKKAIVGFALALCALVALVIVRALMFTSVQVQPDPLPPIDIDFNRAAEHLSQAIQKKTISFAVSAPLSKDEFEAFHKLLDDTYPNIRTTLKRETVGGFSLLYIWPGSDPALKPLLILGHFDVVPVAPDSEKDWQHPPFEGRIADGRIWGRGAKDDKLNVIGAMEAVEYLLAQGYAPKRTIMLSFGHDEEIGGVNGAVKTAALLKERGIQLECVVDEGGSIIEGTLPGVAAPAALIGIAEKGYLTLRLRVQQAGGHSSMPPKNSAIGIVAQAVNRLEANPFPARLEGPAQQMFATLGPEMPFQYRVLFANLWLFNPVVTRVLADSPESNALLRTTTAITMVSGGVKDNVLPTEATAAVNFRILPGDTKESVLRRACEVVGDDRVVITPDEEMGGEPTPVSSVDSTSYYTLVRTIRQVCPDTVVGPYLMLGAADARHFTGLTNNVYRFVPMRFKKGETAMLHGPNEWIATDNFAEVIRFYVQLIRNFDA